jgi:transposase
MGQRKYYYFDCDVVQARIDAGERAADIAEEIGCHEQTIYRRLREHKEVKVPTGKTFPHEAEIKKLRRDGLTLREIAERYDCSEATIFRLVGYKHRRGSSVVELIKSDGDPIAIRADQIGFIEKLSDSSAAKVSIFMSSAQYKVTVRDYDDAVERWNNATYGNDKKGEV